MEDKMENKKELIKSIKKAEKSMKHKTNLEKALIYTYELIPLYVALGKVAYNEK
jgi:hypothetical protein